MNKRKRLEEFDYAKGMAIIGVILGHSVAFCSNTFPLIPLLIEVGIFSFVIAVIPVFLFISGFLGYRSFVKHRNTKEFLFTRAKRLLPSYLIWSTGYLILIATLGRKVGLSVNNNPLIILAKYVFGAAIIPFYYLFILFVFYLITPWLSKFDILIFKKWFVPLTFIALIFASVFSIPYYFDKGFIHPVFAYRNPLFWLLFYVWGIYWAKKREKGEHFPWESSLNSSSIILFSIAYLLAFGVNIATSSYNIPGLNQLSPFVYPYYIAAVPISLRVSYLVSQKEGFGLSILKQFGLHVYGIYLSHYMVLILALLFFHSILRYPLMKSTLLLNICGWLLGCVVVLLIVITVKNLSKTLYKFIF